MCRFNQLLWLCFLRLDSRRCRETWFYPLTFLGSHIYYIILSRSIEFEFPLLFTMTVNMFSLVFLPIRFSLIFLSLSRSERKKRYYETNNTTWWAWVAMSRLKIFSMSMKITVFLHHSFWQLFFLKILMNESIAHRCRFIINVSSCIWSHSFIIYVSSDPLHP
jgi:hypothetical protein